MAIEESLSKFGGMALNSSFIIVALVLAVSVIVALIFFYNKWKRYQEFTCYIFERDGTGQIVIKSDKAGVFVDRTTQNKRFFMRAANVGLTPDNIPYILTTKGKIVFLYRTGLKNFRYVNFKFDDNGLINTVGEEQVNWALNAFDRQKKTFGQDKLLQYLPFIILAFVCIVILIIFIYFFKSFPVLKEVALAFKEAAAELAKSNAGTVVLPS